MNTYFRIFLMLLVTLLSLALQPSSASTSTPHHAYRTHRTHRAHRVIMTHHKHFSHLVHRVSGRGIWRTMFLLTTAYVVNRAERGKCTVNAGTTASGPIAQQGSIAIDPHVFRFGTRFRIPGYGFGTAQDKGSAIIGRHIDLAMMSCRQALSWGGRRILVSYQAP